METIDELKEYLEILTKMSGNKDFKYSSIYDFILKNGKEYEICEGLPKEIERGPLGNCFQNVSEIILNDIKGRYTYVEGYAFKVVIPMAHAWVLDRRTGLAYDPTWEDGIAYFGCEFPSWYLRKQILEHKHYMSMIDNWKGRFPLLTGKHAYPVERREYGQNEIHGSI